MLVLRWFLDDTRITALARNHQIGRSTAYAYRDEAITVLATRKPSLHGALLAAKTAGHSHVILDGTLDRDRNAAPGPTAGGGSVVVGQAAPARREHPGRLSPRRMAVVDPRRASGPASTTPPPPPPAPTLTCSPRSVPGSRTADSGWADLGYEVEAELLRIPIKKTEGTVLTPLPTRCSCDESGLAFYAAHPFCSKPR